LPALIVRTFSQRSFSEVIDTHYLIAFALGSMVSMLAGLVMAHWVLKKPIDVSAISAMGMSCGNSGYIGYPLALLVLGPIAGVALALNMLVENLLMIPLTLALAEISFGKGQRFWPVLRGIAVQAAAFATHFGDCLGHGTFPDGISLAHTDRADR
jgi:malonate transporter